MVPAGEHNGVSVYALSADGKESRMIENPQKKTDRGQNIINSSSGHTETQEPSKYFIRIRRQLFELSCVVLVGGKYR